MNKYVQAIVGTYLSIKLAQIALGVLIVIVLILTLISVTGKQNETTNGINHSGMTVQLEHLEDGGHLPINYTCEGSTSQPSLTIQAIPTKAKYLSIDFVEKIPRSAVKTYWVVWNIPITDVRMTTSGSEPGALVGVNDFNETRYTPPCHDTPNQPSHSYTFRIRAYTQSIPLTNPSESPKLWRYASQNVVAQEELTVRY